MQEQRASVHQPVSEVRVDPADREAILAASVDYIESWLDGDAGRMARCLPRELAKRSPSPSSSPDLDRIESLTRDEMIAATALGLGTRYARPFASTLLDAYGDVATVRLLSSVYMDCLHPVRSGDGWLIVNVIWQRRAG